MRHQYGDVSGYDEISDESPVFVLDYRNGPDELRRKNDGGLVEQIGEVAQVIQIGDDMFVLEHLAGPDELRRFTDDSSTTGLPLTSDVVFAVKVSDKLFMVLYQDSPVELRSMSDGDVVKPATEIVGSVNDRIPALDGSSFFVLSYSERPTRCGVLIQEPS